HHLRQDEGDRPWRDRTDAKVTLEDVTEQIVTHDVLRGAGSDGTALTEHGNMVGKCCRQVEVMQHGYHATATRGKVARNAHHQNLVTNVEAGNWLIEDQPAGDAFEHWGPDLAEHAGKLHA